jgi:hypothetical protein
MQRNVLPILDLGCCRLAERVAQPPAKCSLDQINSICSRIRLCLFRPEPTEEARRKGCNKEEIREFFKRHEHVLNRDASLILNADETQVALGNKFTAICLGSWTKPSAGHVQTS